MRIDFSAPLQLVPHGRANYLMIFLPDDVADFLTDLDIPRAGFGSIKVEARIGRTCWRTSVFPDKSTFLLLVSRKVASAERLTVGDPVDVSLDVAAW